MNRGEWDAAERWLRQAQQTNPNEDAEVLASLGYAIFRRELGAGLPVSGES